jgi:uncharacterized cupredoxin-like copper-binding protein
MVLVLSGCGSGAGTTAAAPSGPPVSELRVGLLEYRLALSAGTLRAGLVTAMVTNAGSTAHDVRFRQGDRVLGATEVLAPGGRQVLRVEVAPDVPVELDCTVTGHVEAGMHSTLSVAA